MYGLTVRWSLKDAPKGTLKALRAYVEDESHAKFAGLDGLRVKTWRAVKGEWFEGSCPTRRARSAGDSASANDAGSAPPSSR